jgi:two-component system aerobic respiration control sensor histidine kinase ArcB
MTNLDSSLRLRKYGVAAASADHAMLAHDIRCALQSVTGAAAVLDALAVTEPDLCVQLARIGESARNLGELLELLLAPSQEQPPAMQSDLGETLRRLDRMWSAETSGQDLRFRMEAAADLPATIDVDPRSLVRILCNLVCNAVKHSGSSEVVLSARRAVGGEVAITVADRGVGLSEAQIAALREPAPAVQVSPDGHGFGLGIVRGLCAEIGADFHLANRPDGGAEAVVLLPARLCSAAAAPATPTGPPPRRAGLSGRHILLAEDNQTNQIVATQMLRALGAEVTLASDGVEALERFEEAQYDLIIVDIEMPRMTGLDVIRAIRARGDARAAAPIVALTAYAMREHRDRIAAAGANGLISKPLTSIEAFGEALTAHLAPDAPEAAAPAPAEAEEPVADQAVYDALCRAIGQDMVCELLEKVVADLRQARADLAGALAPLDRRAIRSASHILISVAGAIGALRLQNCARALNAAAHGEEDPARLPGDVRRCMDEIDAAVAFADSRRQAA